MKIVADSHIPYLKGVLEPFFKVDYIPGHQIDREQVKDADILIVRTRTSCNRDLLNGTRVRYIASATIGYDHIDTQYCEANGIKWVSAPGCNAAAVQQWVGAVIARWLYAKGKSPNGLTMGVVGVGNVGSKVVTLGKAMGMNVVCCDPLRVESENLSDFLDLDELLSIADIISFHVPLTKSGKYPTFHMLNEANLQLCKSNALFINSSRGGVVDESALIKFLWGNPNADAAIDVWEGEPNYNRQLAEKLLVATPHIAGYSLEGKVMATKMVIDSISNHFGLGINPWWPYPNPLAEKLTITHADNLIDAVGKSYSIENDDIRNTSKSFEEFRNGYSYRRDFTGFEILNVGIDSEKMVELGFRLV